MAACGGGSDRPDARIGFIDAAVLDGPMMGMDADVAGPTRVTVRFQGALKAGAEVVFHDADGMPVDTATTNASGVATGTAPEGGIITVGIFNSPGYLLTTYHGVGVDDDILVEVNRPGAGQVEPTSTVTVNFNSFAGATNHRAATCADQVFELQSALDITSGAMRTINAACRDSNGTVNVMVAALDNGGVIAYGGATGLSNGGSTPTITLAAAESTSYHANNLPARVSQAGMINVSVFTQWYVSGAGVGTGVAFLSANAGGDAQGPIMIPAAGYYDFAINSFIAELGTSPRLVEVAIRAQGGVTPYPGPRAVDFAAALPAITSVSVDASAPPAIVVSWTARDPGLGGTDGGRMRADTTNWTWDAIVPPGTTSVTFPTLPAAMAAYNPPSNTPTVRDLLFIETTSAPGYEDLRQDWFRYFERTPRDAETFRLTESTPAP